VDEPTFHFRASLVDELATQIVCRPKGGRRFASRSPERSDDQAFGGDQLRAFAHGVGPAPALPICDAFLAGEAVRRRASAKDF